MESNEVLLDEQMDQKEQKPKKPLLREVLSWVFLVVAAMVAAFFINTVIIVNASVPTASMAPTIGEGTRLVAWRLSYAFNREPARLDVVVFSSPDDTGTMYVKRVIGLPGERVTITNGRVYINDATTPLVEDYIYEPPAGFSLMPLSVIVPDGHVFVMGDHRNDSRDSRGIGANPWRNLFVPIDNIMGRAAFSYFPRISSIR